MAGRTLACSGAARGGPTTSTSTARSWGRRSWGIRRPLLVSCAVSLFMFGIVGSLHYLLRCTLRRSADDFISWNERFSTRNNSYSKGTHTPLALGVNNGMTGFPRLQFLCNVTTSQLLDHDRAGNNSQSYADFKVLAVWPSAVIDHMHPLTLCAGHGVHDSCRDGPAPPGDLDPQMPR
ncbi:hypothetical protein BV22DRAFT_1039846 [Leucogyrophana mollusca]|uniref:Uncharacterized protein n=1 Tax=Leucogyrophana mollusca TaxID=85980 RepID=A0ACB8B6P2_9AGAM|nr:hypothetical protein BV22DRAFT_1039846 [Leucogyrophana mollusca]